MNQDKLWVFDFFDLNKPINISMKREGFFQSTYDNGEDEINLWQELSKVLSKADKPDDVYLVSEAGRYIPLDIGNRKFRLYNAEEFVNYTMA